MFVMYFNYMELATLFFFFLISELAYVCW